MVACGKLNMPVPSQRAEHLKCARHPLMCIFIAHGLADSLTNEYLKSRDCLLHLFPPLCTKSSAWCKEMLNKGFEIHV